MGHRIPGSRAPPGSALQTVYSLPVSMGAPFLPKRFAPFLKRFKKINS